MKLIRNNILYIYCPAVLVFHPDGKMVARMKNVLRVERMNMPI